MNLLTCLMTGLCLNTVDGLYRNTWYYTPTESEYPGERIIPLYGMKGEELIRVSTRFYKELKVEGAGKLADGRVVNFAGRVDGETRYRFVKSEFGLGVGICQLEPLHTIAVDPDRIPFGAIVEIAETKGLKFPNGYVHDGIWRAEDRGSAILKDRIDLFVGAGRVNGDFIEKAGITTLKALHVKLIGMTPDQPSPRCNDVEPGPQD